MADVGPHELQVWMRNADSSALYETWSGLTFAVAPPAPLAVALAASGALPAPAAQQITFTAAASGGHAPLQFKFWRFDAGSGWQMVQDYGTSNTYTWMPGLADVGAHALQVWVRNVGSTTQYDAWAGWPLSGAVTLIPRHMRIAVRRVMCNPSSSPGDRLSPHLSGQALSAGFSGAQDPWAK